LKYFGEKNAGFDVLYHNMKHGQLATKELAEFVRERAAIEETYSKSMSKLAKIASNGSQLGTFAPMWDIFRVSSDKLALCHLELMKKMNDLIRDINKYGDEQVKIHRKTKEELVGTVEAVQALQAQNGHLQKSKEGYHTKCLELDRLKKEAAPQKELEKAELKSKKAAESFGLCIEKYNRVGGEFEQRMSESAQRFQEIEEAHLRQMKQLMKSYSHSIEDTHVQVGQVHEEFKQNVENIGIDILIQKFADQKGTGKERAVCSSLCSKLNFHIHDLYRPDFDDEEPKKFHIQIRPVASSSRSNSVATEKELKATVGTLTLPPNRGTRQQVSLWIPSWHSYAAFSSDSSSPENVEDSGLDSPSHQPLGPSPELAGWAAWPPVSQIKEQTPSRPVDPFFSAFHEPSSGRTSNHQDDSTNVWSVASTRPSRAPPDMDAPSVRFPAFSHPSSSSLLTFVFLFQTSVLSSVHLSRGPSPISLSTQDAWPVAAAITEYINAYFKGGQHNRCLVKITGDLMMSFPAGITRIFNANPNVPVLSFRLVNISRIDHFLPNQKLLYSDPSQSDPETRDFWFNMQALQLYLQREAELNPQASYYNVGVLKYQVSSQDPGRAPLLLSAECQRSGTVTRVSLDYHCCPATAPSTQLTSVQVLMPLDHSATDVQCQPPASWNAEERRLLWKLPNLSPTNHSKGTLCASWQCLEAPRGPPPSLAVQFVGSGTSLSGMDVELVGARYRMSLVKKRFATGGTNILHLEQQTWTVQET
uniref:FCH and mu domain containing endocytic adaptor 1 n=1 Tax=Cyprinodon variegatus TaxID=28743 RepID=A0A3Q2D779_CYPVA